MYTDGLMVIDVCAVTDINEHQKYCKGIIKGDIILSADNKKLTNVSDLKTIISASGKNINLKVRRNEKILEISAEPIITSSGPTFGLWLRDSTAGIGTMTFYNPETKEFGALGHGICDIDTHSLMPVFSGSITDCELLGVIKSSRGNIGELECSFNSKNIGTITANTNYGISGKHEQYSSNTPKMEVASSDEVTTGKATILSEVDSGGVKEYELNIRKVDRKSDNGRDMVIEIADKGLLGITGGIVQGMSGSPIVQNGKLIGAVTHVFVNDPTRGYGIFIENMLMEAEKNKEY